MFAAPGYYTDTSHTLVYNDGSEIPAPNDPPTWLNESVPQPGLIRSSLASANVYPHQTQVFNKQYNPTVRYAGILREVQTQPGFPSMMSYLGLPDALNDGGFFQTNVDGRNGKTGTGTSVFPSRDTGYIYTGGTAYTPKVNRKTGTTNYIHGELDAGLMLYRSSDPTHPGWQPYATPVGTDWQSEVLGEPLENDAAAASKGSNSKAHVFITGEPLMAFKAPGYGTIPDNLVVLSFHALGSGRVFTFDPKTSITKNVGDATFVKFEKGWLRRSSVVLKRMNTIAQVLTPQTSVIPDGPGKSFYKSGAYIRGASWGDLVDPFAEIDGVMLFPGGQWTDDPGITWQEGAYPGPGSRYVTYIEQSPFFWETYINLDTNP